ncbi:MAG: tetratricopeptide repeat protein [Candidatus Thorarchaeota archaeon]
MLEFPEDEAMKFFKEGLNFARSKQLDKAISSFIKAIELDPELIEGWNNLGLAYLQSSQPKKAIESFDNALRLKPGNFRSLKMKADALIRMAKFEGAIGVLEKILSQDEHYPEALFGKAMALFGLKKYNEALIMIDKAAFFDPYITQINRLKGDILASIGFDGQRNKGLVNIIRDFKSNGKFKEAHKLIDKFLKENDIAELHKEKGDIYLDERQYNKAIKSYDKAFELNPYNAGAIYNKGATLFKQGKLTEALPCYTEAVRINPSNQQLRDGRNILLNQIVMKNMNAQKVKKFKNLSEKIHNAMVQAIKFQQNGQLRRALDILENVLSENKNFDSALSLKATILKSMGQFKEAIRIANQVLESKPKDRDLLIDLYEIKGISLKNLRLYDEALQCYDKVINLNPELTAPYTNKGNVYMELDRLEESIEMHQKAIDINPIDELGWNNLGVVHNLMNNFDDALKGFNEALRLNNRFYQSYWGKGMLLKKLGRFEESVEALDKTLAIEEANPSAWYHRGSSLFYLGHYKEAYLSYKRALDIEPSIAQGKHEKMNLLLNIFEDKAEPSVLDTMPLHGIRSMKLLNKGNFLRDHERFEDGIACFDYVLEMAVDTALAWSGKAFCLSMLEQYDEALEAYNKAIEQEDDVISHIALINKANLLMKIKRYGIALREFNKALEKGDDVNLLCGKINALLHLKDFSQAEKVADQVIKMDPNNAEGWFCHGVALLNQRRQDEAMSDFAQATRIDPRYMDAFKNLFV